MAKVHEVEISSEVQGQFPVLRVDQDMIRRVLVNLVTNAIKYSPRLGRVRITASQREEALKFSVIDQGPGILPQYQGRIFDKFARVQYEGAPTGVGLGLAFCRLAVEAHGGRIWVESAPGQGSTFSFTLPLVQHSSNLQEVQGEGSTGNGKIEKDD